jgi:hypothetical protein
MMTIECPSCDAELQAPEELIGKKAKCPECGTSFPIKCFAKSGPPPLPNAKDWYYATGGERSGPVDRREVGRLIMSGQIRRETVIWSDGLPEWMPAGQTEFGTLFGPAEPPPVPQDPANAEVKQFWSLVVGAGLFIGGLSVMISTGEWWGSVLMGAGIGFLVKAIRK